MIGADRLKPLENIVALELANVKQADVWGCGNFELAMPARLFANHRALRANRLRVHPWAERCPGEFECVLSIERPDGTTIRTREVVEWVVELKASCPAAYTSLRLAMAAEAMDQTGAEILN